MAANQPRRRPLAGQRSRSRLEPGGTPAPTSTAPAVPAPADRAPDERAPHDRAPHDRAGTAEPAPVSRPRRTALLERARPEPSPAAGTARADRTGRGSPDLLLMLAGVLVLALVLTAAALTLKARGEDRTEQARTDAVAAAETRAVDLLSYDYRHLDEDFARAEEGLTGRFAKDYARTTESVVRPTAEQVHAVVKAEVVASSVVRASQNRVVVLLFVNQTTASTRVQGPQVDLNRVRMTLQRVSGTWKISAVTAL